MKVDFPDGYPRQLKTSRLWVDGQVVIQNTQPPYDFFGWSLKNYRSNGAHTLQVEVEDILGYEGKSISIIIPVTIAARTTSFWEQLLDFLKNGGWLLPAGILLAGGIYITYRQRNTLAAMLERRREEKEMASVDPLTQVVDYRGW